MVLLMVLCVMGVWCYLHTFDNTIAKTVCKRDFMCILCDFVCLFVLLKMLYFSQFSKL